MPWFSQAERAYGSKAMSSKLFLQPPPEVGKSCTRRLYFYFHGIQSKRCTNTTDSDLYFERMSQLGMLQNPARPFVRASVWSSNMARPAKTYLKTFWTCLIPGYCMFNRNKTKTKGRSMWSSEAQICLCNAKPAMPDTMK